MFTSNRSSRSICRTLAPAAALALAGALSSAQAQTAPQLLPNTVRLIAGGGTATTASGGTCPVSGNKATDAYGDGCLATEIEIGNTASGGSTPGSRSAIADANGNVFFTDYVAAMVRRVDAVTGVVTVVAGGGTTAAGTSSGLLGTAVKLSHPVGLAFAANGDLYFSDPGNGQIFKIAATGGFITTTGVISLVWGNTAGTFGFAASNPSTTITAANSYLRSPYGLAFDSKGDLVVVDEYTEAVVVLNLNATGTNTVASVSVPAGTIWKIAGTSTGASAPYCVNGTASGYGCSYGLYTEGSQANATTFDSSYSVGVGTDGTVYVGNEYYNSVFQVSPSGVLTTFAGIENGAAKPGASKRATAGSFGVGSIFGLAVDANNNVYFTDASEGIIWRVDAAGKSQYAVAGGASTVCSGTTDTTWGNGCPALQAKFGSSGSGNFATTTLPGPGVYGMTVDAYGNLYTGDTESNEVREVATGAQFGVVGANQPTDTLTIHFAPGDGPAASGAYSLSAGGSNFSLGTAACTTNSDNTTDCSLPVTATPMILGAFTGTLTVNSTLGKTANFALSGIYQQSPVTRTTVTTSATTSCSGTSTYSTSTAITITATLAANGPSAPTGTITFLANGAAIGSPQTVSNIGSSTSPVYGAKLTNTFSTVGTYTITATYSGDGYFNGSTGKASGTITTSNPTFTTSVLSQQQNTVSAGQTALYSFTVAQNVYSGTINFACSGLPANSSCSFSPPSLTAAGCSATSTVALSIVTQQGATASGIGSGSGPWSVLSMLIGFGLALAIGMNRRKLAFRSAQLWMALALLLIAGGATGCGNGITGGSATPSGKYTVTVTASGSSGGTTSSFTVPLTVN